MLRRGGEHIKFKHINDVYTFMTIFIEKQGDIFIFKPKFIDVIFIATPYASHISIE